MAKRKPEDTVRTWRKPLQGDPPEYGDRRSQRRISFVEADRRSGKDRRQTWPGAGKAKRLVCTHNPNTCFMPYCDWPRCNRPESRNNDRS